MYFALHILHLNECSAVNMMRLQVSGRIWHHAVEALHTMQDAHTLIAWLPADQLGGKAGAAGALLANLAQVGGTALQVKPLAAKT